MADVVTGYGVCKIINFWYSAGNFGITVTARDDTQHVMRFSKV